MTDNAKKFLDMFRDKLGAQHELLPIIGKMVVMLEPLDEFDDMMEVCTGMQNYGEYISEKEAERITDSFVNFDKTRGAKWPKADMLFETVKSFGGTIEEPRKYNKWVMFVVMNMIHADYGVVLTTVASGTDYARLVYKMAQAFINDPDRKVGVRHYFGLDCKG